MNWTQADLERHMQIDRLGEKPAVKVVIPDDGMNKVERNYSQYLDLLKKTGEVNDWWFESIKFRIGNNCWWTPDFFVIYTDGHREVHDTKGTRRTKTGMERPYYKDDALVKARAVATMYGWPVYFVYRLRNGEWERRAM